MSVVYFLPIYDSLAAVLQHSSGHLWKWVHIVLNKARVRKHSFQSLHQRMLFQPFCLWILWNALEMLLEGNERIRDLFIPNQSSCNWRTVEDVNMLGLLLRVGRLFRGSLSVNSITVTACEVVPVLGSPSSGPRPSHYRQPNLLIPSKIKSVRCSFYSRGQSTLILLCPFPKWYNFNSWKKFVAGIILNCMITFAFLEIHFIYIYIKVILLLLLLWSWLFVTVFFFFWELTKFYAR